MKTVNVAIKFTDGKIIKLELYPEVAPITVANFLKLVNENFYSGLCFHRVIPNFMIQGGGYEMKNELAQKSAPTIKGEFFSNGVKNDISHVAGVISMARTNVKDSASSQFFICVADCTYLDGQYAAFGKTRDKQSLDNAIAISKVPTGKWMYHDDVPIEPVVIESIVVED